MQCPSCREDEVRLIEVPCLDEDGERMSFPVCRNCDYGINEHTEGECDCPTMLICAFCSHEATTTVLDQGSEVRVCPMHKMMVLSRA